MNTGVNASFILGLTAMMANAGSPAANSEVSDQTIEFNESRCFQLLSVEGATTE